MSGNEPRECWCPLCDHECSTYNHLREHLHERHRKSEIIDHYLEECHPEIAG